MATTIQSKWQNSPLSMSKIKGILLIFCTLLFPVITFAQININTYGLNYYSIKSYQTSTVSNFFSVQINSQNTATLNIQKWSLTFQAVTPLRNSDGKEFPLSKLSFQFSNLTSQGSNIDKVTPTVSNVNPVTSPVLFQNIENSLVQNSSYNLRITNNYLQLKLNYNLIIEGGAYLKDLMSYNAYSGNIIVFLKDANGNIIDSGTNNISLQVVPEGIIPPDNKYSITVSPAAKNVLLEFKTPNDYAKGVSKTYPQGLAIQSSTGYNVTVNTLNSNLTSTSNKTIPVSTINLITKDSQTQVQTGNIGLSTTRQTIATGTGTNNTSKYYDLTYSTKAGDQTFFNTSDNQYSGTLVFTLTPQ